MTEDDKQEAGSDEKNDDKGASSEKFDLSEEGQEKVRQMQAAYNDDRETAVLPGTGGTITGVAINEWLDDDGNPKFGQDEQKDTAEHQDKEKQQQAAD
ncbi:MAG: hypothetical protein WBV80_22505 [Mycobacterium sp.]